MSRILILSLVFPPDSVSTAQIVGDLAVDLKAAGHEVVVLTTSPHYNRDEEAEARQPIHPYFGSVLRKSDYHGVSVYHAFMPRKGTNLLPRLIGWSGFHLISTIAGMVAIPRPDVVFAPSPPLTIGVCARFLARFYRVRYIYQVQELYPDVAINLGAISNKWLISILLKMEAYVYKKAKSIAVIAPGMRRRLLQKGVADEKIEVIPNFVNVDDVRPLAKDNEFSRRYNIQDKFVVSYSGNMGPAQGLEAFIDAAELLRDQPSIHFMMMGSGILMDSFARRIAELKLNNFTLLPYQHISLMPQIYAASDLCLVPQTSGIGADAVPSKVYRIMSAARPVLACSDPDSDLANLVNGAACGIVVRPGSAAALAEAIRRASGDPDAGRRQGDTGREHVIAHYTRSVITKRYERLIRTVINGHAANA